MADPRNPFLSTIVGGSVDVETPNGCSTVDSVKKLVPVRSNWETVPHWQLHRGTSHRDAPDAEQVSKANGNAPSK